MSQERRRPPEQREGPVRHVRWARSFEITEFSQRSPSDTILQLPSWDIPVSQGRFRRPKAGSAVPWDDIVLSPRADRHHNARANDRAAAYAYRRALDLERVPGVCDHLPDPAIIIFWDGGVAEKVEYAFQDYTSKRGLPRPPKTKDTRTWSRPDALSIKSHLKKMGLRFRFFEFGNSGREIGDSTVQETPLEELPYVDELRYPHRYPRHVATTYGTTEPMIEDEVDAGQAAHEWEDHTPRSERSIALAAAPALSCPFDLQKEWLADTGTCDDLCPSDAKRKVCNPVKRLKPREFETAGGKLKVDQSLVLSKSINDMELEPVLMSADCPHAVSISKAVVHSLSLIHISEPTRPERI